MKHTFKYLVALIMIILPATLLSDTPVPLGERTAVINFQGVLANNDGLAYDGTVDVKARFYRSPMRRPADLIYAEQFVGVAVEHGTFRVPLFLGTPIDGTAFSINTFVEATTLYADVIINDTVLLEGWPIGSALASVRAEHAHYTEALRLPLSLNQSDIPLHNASLITTGQVATARLPAIPSTRVTTGQFSSSQVPALSAGIITSGSLSKQAFNNDISAALFTSTDGPMSGSLIPYNIMREGDIGFVSGIAANGTAVGIPAGFSRSQCSWALSLRRFNENAGNGTGIDHIEIVTDANGVVSCLWDHVTETPLNKECSVNYLTICKK